MDGLILPFRVSYIMHNRYIYRCVGRFFCWHLILFWCWGGFFVFVAGHVLLQRGVGTNRLSRPRNFEVSYAVRFPIVYHTSILCEIQDVYFHTHDVIKFCFRECVGSIVCEGEQCPMLSYDGMGIYAVTMWI